MSGLALKEPLHPHSSKGSITALDSRTTVAKLLRKITADLLDHFGDPTAPQRLIVQGAAFKALRVALFADRMLNDENALSEKSDHNLLAWSNWRLASVAGPLGLTESLLAVSRNPRA
jgi:hypothetical protein